MNARTIYNMHPSCPKKLNSYEFRLMIMELLKENKKLQSFLEESFSKSSGHLPEKTPGKGQLKCTKYYNVPVR